MDWTKRAKQTSDLKVRRVPITLTIEMQKLMAHYRNNFSDQTFSDTAILETLLEAGARVYYKEQVLDKHINKTPSQTRSEAPVSASDDEGSDTLPTNTPVLSDEG